MQARELKKQIATNNHQTTQWKWLIFYVLYKKTILKELILILLLSKKLLY